ncbi:hypothetical protein [Streptomyces roseolus]|uniref:hypothetical protein n=1 Tax=Streptomyces roseolus TaxID=67358 RepID=UPI0016739B99|nr:hypothetical protein [Streptomyces roseolus]
MSSRIPDPSRPELLVIDAPSITESNAPAGLAVDRFAGAESFDRQIDPAAP